MELHSRKAGEKGPFVVIVHGLYGASDNWMSVASDLADSTRVLLPDQRNHGQSPHNDIHSYEVMADDLYRYIRNKTSEKVILVGHSMGGKTVMRLALEHPEIVEKMVVVDIAPKNYGTHSNYGETTTNHEKIIASLRSLKLDKMKSRKQMDAALRVDLPSKKLRQFLLKNVKRHKNGNYFWQLNLAALNNNLAEIMNGFSELMDKKLSENIPTIFIRGENSPYIRNEDTLIINKFFPGSQVVSIPDAGHWVHAERPDEFLKTLRYFIDE